MIFAHRFNFRNEPCLQRKHNIISSNSYTGEGRTIEVIESSKYNLTGIFPHMSDWFDVSGQEGRYYAIVPFREIDEYSLSLALEIKDVLTLIWDSSSQQILYIKSKNYTPDRLRFWIYHTFFPLVLELKQKYKILHAGSVEIEGKPVLFSAPCFGGKSTLTDYFIRQGHTMLSDDTMAIDKQGETYYALASYPFHRPYRDFETLGYPVENFAIKPKPIHVIYLLEASEPDAAVKIIEIKGLEKFKALYFTSFIDFKYMRKRRFIFFTEMAKHIPVYKIKVPWDIQRLGEVYRAICSH